MNHLQQYITPLIEHPVIQDVLNNPNVKNALQTVRTNENLFVYGVLGLTGALVLKQALSPTKTKKTKKSGKKTKKQQPVVVNPQEVSKTQIEQILADFNTNYVPAIDEYLEQLKVLLAAPEPSKKKGKKKTAKKQAPPQVSYKEKLEYQYLYFNENLLKLLMKLDSVEIHENQDLRLQRKQAIKAIQGYLKQLDSFKPDIDKLTKKGY
ncbi:hypothetical protein OGAPHI_003300 [Ogataea philodendri]|uniref:BAG domain-containing protein n=1 Tax=Ogataea philodendri TaxID=1378263 RepID=A0A9P8P845_9ASCO|nr:uncharacterized protein OGAPHI_003300 [Ogataea philodendri]KAH3666851.1 hypothetical protein OGAPHI_003300 [Ogataea philodendri]